MRRVILHILLCALLFGGCSNYDVGLKFEIGETVADNEIWYTSSDGNVVELHEDAFDTEIVYNTYRNGLGVIKFKKTLTTIGANAFYKCTSLTSVIIPNSVVTIGALAFCECTSLTDVAIGNSVTSIEDYAFCDCSALKSITIPDSVTSIGFEAFYNCTSLTSVTIGNGVAEIGQMAFSQCSSLTSLTLGDGVTKIGSHAFSNCKLLTSVTIPDGVTSMEYYAFGACTSLKSVYCKPIIPPSRGYDMFHTNASGRLIYVPAASIDKYKSASGWWEYGDAYVGYNFQ